MPRKGVGEDRLEPAIDLDGMHVPCCAGQRPRQNAGAGADLEHDILGPDVPLTHGHRDAVLVEEAVLTERRPRAQAVALHQARGPRAAHGVAHQPKSCRALASVRASQSSALIPRTSARR